MLNLKSQSPFKIYQDVTVLRPLTPLSEIILQIYRNFNSVLNDDRLFKLSITIEFIRIHNYEF